MKASKLELYNFRNYEYENISFSDGVNIIHGENGMGKTNILEAVYYFSYGRSFCKEKRSNAYSNACRYRNVNYSTAGQRVSRLF